MHCRFVPRGVLAHGLAGMLYGVPLLDPLTFIGVSVLVLLVAAVAAVIPALRAASVDPMQVLREE